MPRNRKYYPHGSVLLVTARMEEGLPLVCSHIMNFLIWGVLAVARSLYRVKICHFVFLANHFHMIFMVDDPEDVSAFIRYVKTEIAHAVNRLRGRRKRTVWTEGYDSPVVLSAEDVVRYISYLYLNPAKAGLVNSIDEYPGVSSWRMFKTGVYKSKHSRVPRPEIRKLPSGAMGVNEQKRIVEEWKKLSINASEFVLEPWAWVEAFPSEDQKRLKERIVRLIQDGERTLREKREKEGKTVLGVTALRRQSMDKEYVPKKFSRRMICLCFDKGYRRAFVEHFHCLCAQAREVYESWKRGDLAPRIPPGLFSPSVPCLASALSP